MPDDCRATDQEPLGVQTTRILNAAPDGIICLDLDQRITFANRAATHLLGYELADLTGQPIRAHVPLAESPADEIAWRADGSSFAIESQTMPFDEEDGHASGWLFTFRDITRWRVADALKNELVSVVSHELRTPLTSIRSSLGLLSGGYLGPMPDKGQRMLEIAVTNTDRLIRLINDILDLERVDSGDARMHRDVCVATDLMSQAADAARGMAERAGVTLDLRPRAGSVRGDADRLVQVLTNLLSNAIKFSPAGGTVWLESEQSAGELMFRVRDEGRGIPEDKLETVFDRFGQVDPSDARDKGGTGLGLTISRSIVKQHGGQIWAESTLGAGTTMCVALPAYDAELALAA
jgi:signal transduction histidine kinase